MNVNTVDTTQREAQIQLRELTKRQTESVNWTLDDAARLVALQQTVEETRRKNTPLAENVVAAHKMVSRVSVTQEDIDKGKRGIIEAVPLPMDVRKVITSSKG